MITMIRCLADLPSKPSNLGQQLTTSSHTVILLHNHFPVSVSNSNHTSTWLVTAALLQTHNNTLKWITQLNDWTAVVHVTQTACRRPSLAHRYWTSMGSQQHQMPLHGTAPARGHTHRRSLTGVYSGRVIIQRHGREGVATVQNLHVTSHTVWHARAATICPTASYTTCQTHSLVGGLLVWGHGVDEGKGGGEAC